ncbi:hypothetical protein OHA37_22800 [Streptomyces sp. NBC_00335]|uniref:hypothetical protein n=1 Tax=unclassified Streptomyces TaxID=2593676 RepID=UPI002258259C|nr:MULTISPECIES: hypothetical protein [unclassified Streptomyces]MCX5406690.1 hypothetical protein [Streptomyces sp. NBC_00086]
MSDERAQGRGWVRIPASRAEQPGTTRAAPPQPYGQSPYAAPPYAQDSYAQDPYPQDPYPHDRHPLGRHAQAQHAQAQHAQAPYDPSMIYLSLVKRWQEAGRTLPGHPDEEWERLISQPCWPGR